MMTPEKERQIIEQIATIYCAFARGDKEWQDRLLN